MPIVAQITITVDDAGQVAVAGAIENKLSAYALLEIAKDAIREMHAEKARTIQAATPAERLAIVGGR